VALRADAPHRTCKEGIGALLAACLAVAAGCGDDPGSSSPGNDKGTPSITVGSANFPENVVLGEIYAGALEAKNVKVSKKLNIGARAAIFAALERGDVPLIAKTAATPAVSTVLDAVSAKLTTDKLVDLVKRVEVDKDDAAAVAHDFLSENGLK
jgi:osmoprotectant transport system substrate-binding protein